MLWSRPGHSLAVSPVWSINWEPSFLSFMNNRQQVRSASWVVWKTECVEETDCCFWFQFICSLPFLLPALSLHLYFLLHEKISHWPHTHTLHPTHTSHTTHNIHIPSTVHISHHTYHHHHHYNILCTHAHRFHTHTYNTHIQGQIPPYAHIFHIHTHIQYLHYIHNICTSSITYISHTTDTTITLLLQPLHTHTTHHTHIHTQT